MALFEGTTADGNPIIGVVHALDYKAFKEKASFPWLLILNIEILDPSDLGFPDTSEHEDLRTFTGALLDLLRLALTVHEVGRMTCEGIRTVFCYLPSAEPANYILTKAAEQERGRGFAFFIDEDPDWKGPVERFGVPDLGVFTK